MHTERRYTPDLFACEGHRDLWLFAGIPLWVRLFVLVGLPLLDLYLGLFILIAIARGQRHQLRRLVMFGWARAIDSQGERAPWPAGPLCGPFCWPESSERADLYSPRSITCSPRRVRLRLALAGDCLWASP